MIGVVARPSEAAAVEEFFQLFKTPWEWFRNGRAYDVLIVTDGQPPVADTRLLVVANPQPLAGDQSAGIRAGQSQRNPKAHLNYQGGSLPIYGDLLTFAPCGQTVVRCAGDSGVAALRIEAQGRCIFRLGYDLFAEVAFLLSSGQPCEHAHIPTLDLHIRILREAILEAGLPLLEIPPSPAGYESMVCLTHDIDFVGIRRHWFDHTMWGFLYRATLGAARDFATRRIPLGRLLKCWQAAASLPLVYLGWARDFWMQFDWFLAVERNLPATYFLIPFKGRAGERLTSGTAARRATAYDVTDIPDLTAQWTSAGCEIGVHGIDSWHSTEKAAEELGRVAPAAGRRDLGIRMHWLLRDENTCRVLEAAGYAYDSTSGYNETVGYRNGTAQVFRPLEAQRLLELPLHIQDGALFYPGRLGLAEAEAWSRCEALLQNARSIGGVLTLLWHDRSPGPERFWGDFYARLVAELKARPVWFDTASRVVRWFGWRRGVAFETVAANGSVRVAHPGGKQPSGPPLIVRAHRPSRAGCAPAFVDYPWNGESPLDFDPQLQPCVGTGTAIAVSA